MWWWAEPEREGGVDDDEDVHGGSEMTVYCTGNAKSDNTIKAGKRKKIYIKYRNYI